MKWIGQHIWDFISRFRSDVYLEGTETGTIASGGNLGLDSNNKIVKAVSGSGDLTITNAGDNRVVTSTGGTGLEAEASLFFDAGSFSVSSATSTLPQMYLINDNADANGSQLWFNKLQNGADDDVLGVIKFVGDDEGGGAQSFVEISGSISDATPGDESGKLEIKVATNSNEWQQALTATGLGTGSRVDVGLGYGEASTTTIAGDAIVSGNNITVGHDDDDVSFIKKLAHSDGSGGRLYIQSADATDGQTDKSGGHMFFYSGRSTGTGDFGSFGWYAGREAASTGTGLNTSEIISKLESIGSGVTGSTDQYWYEGGGISTNDYFKLSVAAHGATTLSTVDASFSSANLTLDAHGDITLDSHTGDDIFFKENGSERIQWHMDATPTMEVTGNFNIDGSGDVTLDAVADVILTAGNGLTVNSGANTFTSASANRPLFTIKNTANDATGPFLYLENNRDDNGLEDNDVLGTIAFIGEDVAGSFEQYGSIEASVVEADHGDEAGQIAIKVANDGTERNGIVMAGSKGTAEEVNVAIANGAASVTTIAGTLTTGSTAAMTNAGLLSVANQSNITGLGTLTGLTTSGAIELGHASDTTLARSASGIATIEGKQIFTTNVPALTSGAAGVPAVTMQARRTITTAEANDMHNTAITLVPGQGTNTVILPIGGVIMVDRASTQSSASCDLNMHISNHPGVFGQTSLAHARRFMYNESGDRTFSITTMIAAAEISQAITGFQSKALQVSFDAAATTDCFTSIEVFLTYQVINLDVS